MKFKHFLKPALALGAAVLLNFSGPPAAAQPATIPSAFLKVRYGAFSNAFTTNVIGATNGFNTNNLVGGNPLGYTVGNSGGVICLTNSQAVYFATVQSNNVAGTNWTMIPLNRGRGIAVYPWLVFTNLAAGTNLVTWNFTGSYDGTNFIPLGPGGIGPFNYTMVGQGTTAGGATNPVMGYCQFSANAAYNPGAYTNGVLAGIPGTVGMISTATSTNANYGQITSPIGQACPLDNIQYLLLISVTNCGSQPVWIHTNGVNWAAFP